MAKKDIAKEKAVEYAKEFGHKPTIAELARYSGVSYSTARCAVKFTGLAERCKPGRKQKRFYRYRRANPDPIVITEGADLLTRIVYIGGRWHKAKMTADGWRMAGRVGKDLRELAREVGK